MFRGAFFVAVLPVGLSVLFAALFFLSVGMLMLSVAAVFVSAVFVRIAARNYENKTNCASKSFLFIFVPP